MKIIFDRSFNKSLDKIHDQDLKRRIEKIIFQIDAAFEINSIPNVKKMQGYKNYFRIRVGDYRIGLELENTNTVRFLIVAHRKEVYKVFP